MFVETTLETGTYGIASDIPRNTNTGNPAVLNMAIFTVTKVGAVARNRYTFAHEIAHNLGAAHTGSSAGVGWTDNARGYELSSSGYTRSTVMDSTGSPPDRIPFLSNPSRNYTELPYFSAVPTGTGSNNNASALIGSRNAMAGLSGAIWFAESAIWPDEWRGNGGFWFGLFWVGQYPVVWHDYAQRWIWVYLANSPASIWIWDYNLNADIWTEQGVWPWAWNNSTQTWMWLY